MEAKECCIAILTGLSSDTSLYDSCETFYDFYDYSTGTCLADKIPVHPDDNSFVATIPVVSADTRDNIECCAKATETTPAD